MFISGYSYHCFLFMYALNCSQHSFQIRNNKMNFIYKTTGSQTAIHRLARTQRSLWALACPLVHAPGHPAAPSEGRPWCSQTPGPCAPWVPTVLILPLGHQSTPSLMSCHLIIPYLPKQHASFLRARAMSFYLFSSQELKITH